MTKSRSGRVFEPGSLMQSHSPGNDSWEKKAGYLMIFVIDQSLFLGLFF